ncbi:MAG: hypothetical protein KGH69_04665 [Candidatus Micrarchaeota archaeon]|nr:hypothetical protein [Candidatus Micrarchaeota archaeon]
MSLEEIRKGILSDAESRADEIGKQADSEVEAIVSEAKKKAKEITAKAEEEAKAQAERVRKENDASLDIQADTITAEAKGAVIEKAVKELMHLVEKELVKNQMGAVVKKAAKEFAELTGSSEMTIRARKSSASMLKDVECKREYADVDGFVIVSEDGKMAMRIDPEGIADKYIDVLRKNASATVFKERRQSAPKRTAKAKSSNAPRKAQKKAVKKAAKKSKKR